MPGFLKSWRVLPIWRTKQNMQAGAIFQQDGVPVPGNIDYFGAIWTHEASAAQVSQANTLSGFNAPAAATVATKSFAAAGGGKRNVLTAFTIYVGAVAAQGKIDFVVRDGATGVGAILYQTSIGPLAINGSETIHMGGLNIVGSQNVIMTIETTAAPAATNFASVAGSGYIAGA